MKLYELSTQYAQFVDMLESAQMGESEAIDAEVIKDTLDAIEEALEIKAENIALVLSELKATQQALEAEAKRLNERATMIGKQHDSLKQYLFSALELANKEKFKTLRYSFTIKKNAPSVQVIDESLIPSEYIRIKIETAPDKKAIAEILKANGEVAGCTLVQSRTLVIK
jgi:hypothetical protein